MGRRLAFSLSQYNVPNDPTMATAMGLFAHVAQDETPILQLNSYKKDYPFCKTVIWQISTVGVYYLTFLPMIAYLLIDCN